MTRYTLALAVLLCAVSGLQEARSQQTPDLPDAVEKQQISQAEEKPRSNVGTTAVHQPGQRRHADDSDSKPNPSWGKRMINDPVALFTGLLTLVTFLLVRNGVKQEKMARMHERAYITGGGPTNIEPDANGNDRMMVIHNSGRTPGFVTHVKYGFCPPERFPKASISKIISKNMLPDIVRTVENADNIFPPTTEHRRYRHVRYNARTEEGKIFFGKIWFKDVFGDKHYSTFKLLLNNGGSHPLPGGYSEDWK